NAVLDELHGVVMDAQPEVKQKPRRAEAFGVFLLPQRDAAHASPPGLRPVACCMNERSSAIRAASRCRLTASFREGRSQHDAAGVPTLELVFRQDRRQVTAA